MCSRRHHFFRFFISTLAAMLVLLSAITVPAAPPAAPANGAPKVLRIGLIPEKNLLEQRQRYQPLLDYLSTRLPVEFDIKTLFRYGDVISLFHKNELDGAFFGSFTASLAISRLGVEPIARPQLADMSSTYKGVIFVRRNSNIANAGDMRDKRMVFVDRATTAGYLFPLVYLKDQGVDNYQDWFASFYFSGTHEDAILEVLNGHADVGAAKSTVFDLMSASNPRIAEELMVLAISPAVPETTLALRSDLPRALITLIREELLTMHQTPEGRRILDDFGAQSFIATAVADYQPVLAYAERIGIDLGSHVVAGCGGIDCTCRAEGCTSEHRSCARKNP